MLFLAVFCGMMAEYKLEHIVEQNREKQYIKSFIENIKSDTISLQMFIKLGKQKEKGLDSLLQISKDSISTSSSRKLFYTWSIRTLSSIPTFSRNDATSSQLRNSGGYRLIQKKGVADTLTTYDEFSKLTSIQAQYYSDYFNQINSIWHQIVNLTVIYDTSYFHNGAFTDKELPVLVIEPQQKLLFNNKIIYFSGVLKNYNQILQAMLDYAKRIIPFLQKKYGLKNA